MNTLKRLVVLCLVCFSSLFAREASFSGRVYDLTLSYADVLHAGEAAFVRLDLTSKKGTDKSGEEPSASLTLTKEGKKLDGSVFFILESRGTKKYYMVGAVPLSVWLKAGEYELCLLIKTGEEKNWEIDLPLKIEPSFFPEETENALSPPPFSVALLNEKEKLASIFSTVNSTAIFSLNPFSKPIKKAFLFSPFGTRYVKIYGEKKKIRSTEETVYASSSQREVRAASRGRVVLSAETITRGKCVIIEHFPGLYSVYSRLERIYVKEGKIVNEGDVIAKVKEHLGFAVSLNNCFLDGEFFMENYCPAQ